MIDYDYRLDYISKNSYLSLIFSSTDTKLRLEADLPLKAVEPIQSETGFYLGEIKDSPTMRFINDKTNEQVVLEEKYIRQFVDDNKVLGVVKTDRYYFHVIPKYVVELIDMLEFTGKSRNYSTLKDRRGHLDSFYLNLPYSDFTNLFLGTGFLEATDINHDLITVYNGKDFTTMTYRIPDIKKFNAFITKVKVLLKET